MRAIILAAGMGTRLRPLTDNKPKGLVEVDGIPMVEREIVFLKEIGIDEIIVVTGYLKEQFDYLKDKYGVKLIYNDKYDIYNNVYTMYLVRDYLNDSYVLESDIYLEKNILDKNIKRTSYFGGKERNFEKEWIFKVDENNRIKDMVVGSSDEDIILKGISYWNEENGKFIARKLEEAIKNRNFSDMYWDDIVIENLDNVEVFLKKLEDEIVFEIDTLEDLEKINNRVMV